MMLLPDAPHSKSPEELYTLLESSPLGIDAAAAQSRLDHYGFNTLTEEQRTLISIFLSQFKSPIVAILIAAALLSYIMENRNDSMIIVGILVVNSLLGFFQEYRAETSIQIGR